MSYAWVENFAKSFVTILSNRVCLLLLVLKWSVTKKFLTGSFEYVKCEMLESSFSNNNTKKFENTKFNKKLIK